MIPKCFDEVTPLSTKVFEDTAIDTDSVFNFFDVEKTLFGINCIIESIVLLPSKYDPNVKISQTELQHIFRKNLHDHSREYPESAKIVVHAVPVSERHRVAIQKWDKKWEEALVSVYSYGGDQHTQNITYQPMCRFDKTAVRINVPADVLHDLATNEKCVADPFQIKRGIFDMVCYIKGAWKTADGYGYSLEACRMVRVSDAPEIKGQVGQKRKKPWEYAIADFGLKF